MPDKRLFIRGLRGDGSSFFLGYVIDKYPFRVYEVEYGGGRLKSEEARMRMRMRNGDVEEDV